MLLFLYLIPNGRFSPRWAYIPLIATVLLLSLPISDLNSVPAPVLALWNISVLSLVLFGAGTQIYRYFRDSNEVERQQTRWIIFGIVIFVSAIISWVLIFGRALDIPAGGPRIIANLIGMVYSDYFALAFLPIAIAIAILRYRLWGIDVIIRKTLVYLLLSGMLVLVYFGMVVFLQGLLDTFTSQQSPIIIVISTLTIAALFNPLRRRVQTFIDRRFYRKKYDAQQVLARFGQTAQDEVALDTITAELANVAQETFQPEHISVWLKPSTKHKM